jgi:CheY-like chemotaxis protein
MFVTYIKVSNFLINNRHVKYDIRLVPVKIVFATPSSANIRCLQILSPIKNFVMKNYKILFVDDDQQILSIVEQFLSRSGFNITTESNGLKKQSRRFKKQLATVVVFTDLIMPEISGMEILKQVKAASPETEVIIVSGYGTIESAIEAMKLGSYDFLQKPIQFRPF